MKATGKATRVVACVRMKAIGQAMMNCLGQACSHSAVSPMPMADMMPDMERAIMKVMRIWAIIRVRLSIVLLKQRAGLNEWKPEHDSTIPKWRRGFVASTTRSCWAGAGITKPA